MFFFYRKPDNFSAGLRQLDLFLKLESQCFGLFCWGTLAEVGNGLKKALVEYIKEATFSSGFELLRASCNRPRLRVIKDSLNR